MAIHDFPLHKQAYYFLHQPIKIRVVYRSLIEIWSLISNDHYHHSNGFVIQTPTYSLGKDVDQNILWFVCSR